jgi:hypothetical protein
MQLVGHENVTTTMALGKGVIISANAPENGAE